MTMPDGEGTEGATPSNGGESAVEPQTPVAEPGTGEEGTPVSKADLAKELDKWKALSRKNELRAKENSAAARKLADFENANKSELQKAQDEAARAQAEAATFRAEKFRIQAASAHGLSSDLGDYLGDGDEDAINDRADSLSKLIGSEVENRLKTELAKYGISADGQAGMASTAAGAASLSLGRRPVESLRPGSAPASDGTPANPNDAFRQMMFGR